MAGEITFRLANDLDIDGINAFYNSVYKEKRSRSQFIWEYNSAPAGKSLYMLAFANGEIVGTLVAIPFFVINIKNQELLTAKLEDLLVSPNHRGKNIFENMYKALLIECQNKNFDFVWGFAYLDKLYTKIGFEIPYKTSMALLTLSPFNAANYFNSISAKKNISSSLKIIGLSFYSYINYKLLVIKKRPTLQLDYENINYNNQNFNYIYTNNLFGLKLNQEFIDYRININPYSKNYQTINYHKEGVLQASIIYNITKQNVGFIIHLYFAPNLNNAVKTSFILQVIKQSDLKNTNLIRFWGFTHNQQNAQEVFVLKKCNFIFLNRGISFVGLRLNKSIEINFSNFVLSRMASQGTD